MKILRKNILALVLLIMGVVTWLSPNFVVSADGANPKISISNPPNGDKSTTKSMCDDVNNEVHNAGLLIGRVNGKEEKEPFLSYDFSDNVITIEMNKAQYNKLGEQAKQRVMQIALDNVYNSDISRTNRNKIYNELCSLDTATSSLVRQLSEDVNADFYEAYQYFKPFSGFLGVVMGVMALGIFALVAFVVLIDIAYITVPFIQLGLTNESGKVKLVSIEAQNAVKEQATNSGTKDVNPLGIYLKSKGKQFVALAICLLYLCSGQIYTLLASFMDYFSGLLR